MWLSVFTMDWDWLTSFPSVQERVEAFSRDDSVVHREDEDEINGQGESDREYADVWDALDRLLPRLDKRIADLIATGFFPLLTGKKELELTDQFSSISPTTVRRMAAALDALDLWSVARELAGEDGDEYVAEDHAFLERNARIIRRASERGWGIFTHFG